MKALITIITSACLLVACGGSDTAEETPVSPAPGTVSPDPGSQPEPEEPTDEEESTPLADLDADGIPDEDDDDIDGDGVLNGLDAFPTDSNEQTDTDNDGTGNNADLDDDGDGYPDLIETSFGSNPLDATSIPDDLDGDGAPDTVDEDIDGDGVLNGEDAFPTDSEEQVDTDTDGVGNNSDTDDDGDGYPDLIEMDFGSDPLDATSVPDDLDSDGTPDTVDEDIDGDGVLNAFDAFPNDPNEQTDTDNDGTGNNADTDDDNDGYSDNDEVAAGSDPLVASDTPADLDNDLIPDLLDDDIDGDGVLNGSDAFPNDPNEQTDTDDDGTGNNADTDDDNDGYSDNDEIAAGSDPLVASDTPADLDNDLIPDLLDDDIDGDGVLNDEDAYPRDPTRTEPDVVTEPSELDTELLEVVSNLGFDPTELTERVVPQPGDPLVELGKELFFSRSLSFGDDVACASCHDPRLAGTDNLSLPVGVGAHNPMIVGPGRRHDGNFYIDPKANFGPNVPRNSPTTFNIAFYDRAMFWDGRIETIEFDTDRTYYVGADTGANNGEGQLMRTPDSHFRGPDRDAGPNLTAAQARFPVTSVVEMRGFSPEAGLTSYDTRDLVAQKLLDRGWESYFREAFNDYISLDRNLISYDRIALALGEYQRSQVALDYPFARYVQGELNAVSESAKQGAMLFFGEGKCYGCHTGAKLSDEEFYPLATPQIGRGKNVFSQDFGRYNTVPDVADKFAFRTPSLINAELTFPYMHAGAVGTLEDAIRWHFDPVSNLEEYDYTLEHLPQFQGLGIDTTVHQAQIPAISSAYQSWRSSKAVPQNSVPSTVTDEEVEQYAAFIRALTADCLKSSACVEQWMPDYEEVDPDGFRLEPELSFFDNSTVFEIFPPDPSDPIAPVFPDLSDVVAADFSGCAVTDVDTNMATGVVSGFQKVSLSGFYDSHRVGREVLNDIISAAEVALVIGSVAAADIDGDCDFDIAIGLGKNKGIKIYLNENGRFTEAPDNFGLDSTGDIAAFSMTDINGDGWPDILVGHVYQDDSKLWLNNGGTGFVRVTQFGHDTVRTTHNSTFADIDNDGDLDIFSHNWDFMRTAEEIHIWKNDGRGFFEPWQDDVVFGAFGDRDYTFATNFADMNKDGNLDILVAADFQRSQVFQGTDSGEYINVTRDSRISDYNAMGAALGDFDNDLDVDWFVTNIQVPLPGYEPLTNRLYRNQSVEGGDVLMEEISETAGVQNGLWAWGTCMKDFDNDGWLDIFHVNGYGYSNITFDHPLFNVLSWVGFDGVYDLLGTNAQDVINTLYGYFGGFSDVNNNLGGGYLDESQFLAELEALIAASEELSERVGVDSIILDNFYGTPARLYMNNQDGTFREEAGLRRIDDTGEGRGIVCNDFDRDGDIDIVIMNHDGLPSYYENEFRRVSNFSDNFLNVRLHGPGGNQYAYGAKVYATSDSLQQYREMRFENNYMSNNAPELHFGLAADDVLSELRVEWPDGEITVLTNVDANQFIVIEHPSYTD
ncbi:MAG: cytochrome c peroxidase [Pseudomonadota bacterium]|nr:cytochrome c peroxidase [Pseudomonadota bacterium]MEC8104261.1 cytochrome c peroxidase [Pseudomonadota bacterium]MEC8525228.1 cytochrome c peroxidase [Pseudomonadota bacterium]